MLQIIRKPVHQTISPTCFTPQFDVLAGISWPSSNWSLFCLLKARMRSFPVPRAWNLESSNNLQDSEEGSQGILNFPCTQESLSLYMWPECPLFISGLFALWCITRRKKTFQVAGIGGLTSGWWLAPTTQWLTRYPRHEDYDLKRRVTPHR